MQPQEESSVGRILVVDDEGSVREILRDFLSFEGFHVTLATDGQQGLEYALSEPFDLVLTDLEMPRLNGLEFLGQLKQLKNAPAAIMMTGYGTVESAIEAMKVGAYDYILKPFQIEELAHLIRKALDHKRLAEENIRLHGLVSLYQVGDRLNRARSVHEVAAILHEVVAEELEPDWVTIWHMDRGQWQRVLAEDDGRRDADAQAWSEFDSVVLLKAFHDESALLLAAKDFARFFPAVARVPRSTIVVPMRIHDRVIGMLAVADHERPQPFTEGNRKTAQLYADRAAVTIENLRLYEHLKQTFLQTIESLVGALEAKDEYTRGHSERVSQWAVIIGEVMDLSERELVDLKRGSLLHDIGKIGLNLDTLNKPGGLTDEEFERFKLHPVLSKRILEPIEFLHDTLPTVLHHHERWDGKGYPLGLSGKDIPLGARILSIADSFEVMITDRVYRTALPLSEARKELERCAGSQFDPEIIRRFLGYLDQYEAADQLPVKGGRRSSAPDAAPADDVAPRSAAGGGA